MSLYVFALVDAPPAGRPGTGLSGPLSLRRVGDAFALIERREDVPPAEFGTLQRHQAVLTDVAARVPAIIPVRFGTLMDADTLDEALNEREEDLEEAFATVRDRVQFTWRRSGAARTKGSNSASGSRRSKVTELSGAEYLRGAARRSRPAPPAAWKALRGTLAHLVALERYQPATGQLPESLYHLVPRAAIEDYQQAAAELRARPPAPTLTGPFPPFAFAPELL